MYTGRIVCTDGLLVIVDAHARARVSVRVCYSIFCKPNIVKYKMMFNYLLSLSLGDLD